MNKVNKQNLTRGRFTQRLASGTYLPISTLDVRLPSGFPVCSEQDVAARQISSTFASVFALPIGEPGISAAQAAVERVRDEQSKSDRIDLLAEEFSKLRG